jgi:hypothetical protein
MSLRKRIEQLEARRPSHDRRLDALLWRAMATLGLDERERRILVDHAEAVEAGLAHGEPAEAVGMWRGLRPTLPTG